ncbi:hypothetical protein UFOVP11_50 [uncultured Caudovirales phage]|uniref:Uncharacterized protein n=1 Tax=uncultured Caudovirales phage TaxID=2100421 RepID=A0A6J5KKI2_9CAUD|nr:hypothetical protein UFOVP11_50 [uncultured Caudovirales phage]
MNIEQKIELVKAWGFVSAGHNLFERNEFAGWTEYYSPLKPDHIDFHNESGEFNHDYKIRWSDFEVEA